MTDDKTDYGAELRLSAAARRKAWDDLFPMTIDKIAYDTEPVARAGWGESPGSFVTIRPIGNDNPENKTFLGLLVGDIAVTTGVSYKEGEGGRVLTVKRSMYNPAIFVFELKRIVFGYESWWGVIESEDQLSQITDADINDVWYVRALKALAADRVREEAEAEAE